MKEPMQRPREATRACTKKTSIPLLKEKLKQRRLSIEYKRTTTGWLKKHPRKISEQATRACARTLLKTKERNYMA